MHYRFDEFVFDPDAGLTWQGEARPLEPMAHELLHFLLQNAGRVVGRDELNAHLWQGRIVSDAALSTQIRGVRRALGDDRAQQRFIRTYPRRGFSFVAPVERVAEGAAPAVSSGPGRRRLGWIAAAGAAVAVLAAILLWPGDQAAPTREPPERALSIAVLPFENLSGDASKAYLADAFTEDLITDLSRIRDAFVISRSTTFTYRGKPVDAATVAAELGVRYVLEGSLRVDGESVRINAQLIDGETSSHLWSDRYDRPLAQLFDVQENLTGRIASVLSAELREAENRRQDPEVTQDAWHYALRGNVILYNGRSADDYREAFALLTKATELDPTIASAWAGLSFIHYAASLTPIPGISRPDSSALSLATARRAVEADPMNAEPYWLVGAGYARNGQPELGMPACRTAIELNPNMDCAHVCAGLVSMANGAPEEAVPYFLYSLRLNPRFRRFIKEKFLGLAYIQSGRDDLAIAALNRSLADAPRDMFANLALASALALDGQAEAGHEVLARYREAAGRPLPSLAALRASLGWMGPNVERMLEGLSAAGMPDG